MPKNRRRRTQATRTSGEELRALHVLVPEDAHLQARKAALDSRMPFRIYMGHLMSAAQPISINLAAARVEESAPEDIQIQEQAAPVTVISERLASAQPLSEQAPPGPQATEPESVVDDSFDLFT